MRRVLLSCCLALATTLCLAGCSEVEETWQFDTEGGGVWTLDARWNASLWRRTTDLIGRDAAKKLLQPAFPLHPGPWKDAVARGHGLKLEEAGFVTLPADAREDQVASVPAGWRHFRVRIRFTAKSSITSLGPIAGRGLRVEPELDEEGKATGRVAMRGTPFPAVPVLDVAAELLKLKSEGALQGGAERGPLARLGLRSLDTGLLEQMVAPLLKRAEMRFVVEVPREIAAATGGQPKTDDTRATLTWAFADLSNREVARKIEVLWTPGQIDTAPSMTSTEDKHWKAFTTTR